MKIPRRVVFNLTVLLLLSQVLVLADRFGDFEFKENENSITIIGYHLGMESERIEIPSIINGKPVREIGDAAFKWVFSSGELVVPDSVEIIGDEAFLLSWFQKISLGSGVSTISPTAFALATYLSAITVDHDNPNYEDVDGVLFDKSVSTLLRVPPRYPPESGYTVPASVTEIAESAFDNTDFRSITFPEGLQVIGDNAFRFCISLEALSFPASLASLGRSPFVFTPSLVSFSVDERNEHFSSIDGVLYNKAATELVAFPLAASFQGQYVLEPSVTEIGDFAFYLSSFSSVVLPDSLKVIGEQAFANCESLTEISIPSEVTEIGHQAFTGCMRLSEFVVSEGNAYYVSVDGVLYNQAMTELIQLPAESVLRSLEIPDGVVSIHDTAFQASKLTEVHLPSTVSFIGKEAFLSCSELALVNIPSGIERLNESVFQGCNSLTSIDIPTGVTSIGRAAFSNCVNLESVSIPQTVAEIENEAFSDCQSITSMELPPGITALSERVFQNCRSLETISIPEGVITIGEEALYGCIKLTSLSLPDSIITIGPYAFSRCTNLETVNIPPGVTALEENLFWQCDSLEGVSLSDGLLSIGNRSFMDCRSLSAIFLPASLLSIGEEAFSNCRLLVEVTIPSKVTSIGGASFADCLNLERFEFLGDIVSIGNLAFYGCERITRIFLPESLRFLGGQVFWECDQLKRVFFWGDAPQIIGEDNLFSVSPIPSVFYLTGKSGFDNLPWSELGSIPLNGSRETITWLVNHEYPQDADPESESIYQGLPQLAYYSFNQSREEFSLPQPTIVGTRFDYRFFGNRQDVTYLVEISKDLITWTTSGVSLTNPDAAGYRTASLNLVDGRCFVRFRFVSD